ncbi:MAG: benzoate-CoA ligase family protein [Lautropia sp.]|nr:benzoate-CoA ligase family protein [Lautropia sp.]
MESVSLNTDENGGVALSNIPRDYNAAHDLLQRNLQAGRVDQVAFVDERSSITYGELARRVDRFALGLHTIGVGREDRIMLCLTDTIDWPTIFLGAIKAGVVPVCVSTSLSKHDYDYILRDSRAKALFVSRSAFAPFDGLHNSIPTLQRLLISEAPLADGGDIGAILDAGGDQDHFDAVDTSSDEPCFWMYSAGSHGHPRATLHCHAALVQMAELYGQRVLGLTSRDRCFSAPRLCSAYGLCNSLIFPMVAGAMAVLKSAPAMQIEDLISYLTGRAPAKVVGARPTVFFGVPAAFAALLANPNCPESNELSLRLCISAGEAMPDGLRKRVEERLGTELLNGVSSTEMLHIYLSTPRGDTQTDNGMRPVPGYCLRLVDEQQKDVADGDVGTLLVNGPSAALGYWNQREPTRDVFLGRWVRTGDRFWRDEAGYYHYAGRCDDLLKISGQFVSPAEVATTLTAHEDVAEAAVIGVPDADGGFVRPKALIVLKPGVEAGESTEERLRAWLRDNLAQYKCPRWIEFVEKLPSAEPRVPEARAVATKAGAAAAAGGPDVHIDLLDAVLREAEAAQQDLTASEIRYTE